MPMPHAIFSITNPKHGWLLTETQLHFSHILQVRQDADSDGAGQHAQHKVSLGASLGFPKFRADVHASLYMHGVPACWSVAVSASTCYKVEL